MKKVRSGGGWPAVRYALKMARQSGGIRTFYKALSSRNACKTCALGMGGQRGGMIDESGHFPEVCKKSMQAMAADMQAAVPDELFSKFTIDQLATLTPRELEHLGRLTHPLFAGPDDTHLRPISWDEAIDRSVKRFESAAPDDHFFYASGRSSNEAAFCLQLFARLFGTNQINNCSYYCHQASGVGLSRSLGTGTATIVLEDLQDCDFFVLIGGNPASNHPRLMRQLMHIRRAGGEVIVVNPMIETGLVRFSVPSDVRSLFFGTAIASLYVQPHIGGDIALIAGVAKRLCEMGAIDGAFIESHTSGWDAMEPWLAGLAWDDIERRSGVARAAIADLAQRYARADNAVFAWTMGITQHEHGVDNVASIVNLALMRGMVGRPGCGLLPIRGHSNVQGIGSVGVTPQLKDAFYSRLQDHLGVTLPTSPGLDTLSCIEAMRTGRLQHAWCLGGNLYGASPDAHGTRAAFAKLSSVTYLSTTMNTGHVLGRARETLILPVLARDEEPQNSTQESMFNLVRLSDGGPRRHDGPRSEIEVIADLAGRVLGAGPVDWPTLSSTRNIRQVIAAVVPGYARIARIDDSRDGGEFQLDGRTFHEPRFSTPDGRARLCVPAWPEPRQNADDLRLMTIRSEGQFNTVVYEEHDLYRHQDRRDVILMHADDIADRGLIIDQRVSVSSACGTMRGQLVRAYDIRRGNAAMYFPEANILVPNDADTASRTPAYKNIPITVTPEVQA